MSSSNSAAATARAGTSSRTTSTASVGGAGGELSARQVETVNRLVEAAEEELRAVGYGGLTVRNVAARAGVAPATAYTYFESKEHLVSEVFWRRLKDLAMPDPTDARPAAQRVADALRAVSDLVADEPEISAAVTTALLAHDPAVKRLRDRIGLNIRLRLASSLARGSGDTWADGGGADGRSATPIDPTGGDHKHLVEALELLYAGALLQAGTGHLSYDELGDRLVAAASLILGGTNGRSL